jgi:uncharacterized membrane protein YkoI
MRILILAAVVLATAATTAQTQTISAARARRIALAQVSNNQGVISEKLKTRNGILVYEFDIETAGPGHQEIRINANTGGIVANKHEDDLIGGTAAKAEKTADKIAKKADHEADKILRKDEIARANVSVSEARARQIAMRHVPNGSSIRDIDLERENGIMVWEVEVETPGKGYTEVMIDAHSGTVLQQTHKH